MKQLTINISIIVTAFFALSCQDEKNCCANDEQDGISALLGEWLLYERGYSPGSGYIIDPVSPSPPQRIRFLGDGELSTTVQGLTEYKYYSIKGDIVGLFKTNPGPAPDSAAFTHSYHFIFEEGNLKLWFRYCIEGCHLGFKKEE